MIDDDEANQVASIFLKLLIHNELFPVIGWRSPFPLDSLPPYYSTIEPLFRRGKVFPQAQANCLKEEKT